MNYSNKNMKSNFYLLTFLLIIFFTINGYAAERKKYNFNREINDKRISREKILLPVNDQEQPDYEYMEQYMKNLMYKKIKQYLEYIEKQSS